MGKNNRSLSRSLIEAGFPYLPLGLSEEAQALGMCDPAMGNDPNRLSVQRFDTGFARFAVSGGNLLLGAGGTLNLFTAGVDEQAQGGGTQNDATTDAIREGGVVPSTANWISVGVAVSILKGFNVAAGASVPVPAASQRIYRANGEPSAGDYYKRCGQAVADVMALRLFNQDDPCKFRMGRLGMWGDNSVSSDVALSKGGVPGVFWFLATPFASSGANQSESLRATLTNAEGALVEGVAGSVVTPNEDVIIPISVAVIGYPVCPEGSGGVSPELDELRRKIEQLEKQAKG